MSSEIQLFGIFGYPVIHTMSPYMHNEVFEQMNLPYFYTAFEVLPQNLAKSIESIRVLGLKGVNITIPHKEAVLQYLDEIIPSARFIGAVNTIKNEDGKLIGYNTDGLGFITAIREDLSIDPAEKSFLLLGAGGAARAIAIQLALEKCRKIYIANRTLSKAENIAYIIKKNVPLCEANPVLFNPAEISRIIKDVDILVNTTSVGMKKDDSKLLDSEFLSSLYAVIDIIYNPPETLLLKEASRKGLKTANGLGMLTFQGALAFEIWTGIKPPVNIMRNAIIKQLKKTDT